MPSDRIFDWADEARVITHPPEPASPHYHADLAACVRRAIELSDSPTAPEKVEIEHNSGFIGMDEIRSMAASPDFPTNPEAPRLQTTSLKP